MEITNLEISKSRNPEDNAGLLITIKQQERMTHDNLISTIASVEEVTMVEEIA